MKGMSAFWSVLIVVAAWPMVVVALFAMQRRYPSGAPAKHRWIVWGVVAVIYLGAAGFFFVTATIARGLMCLVAGIAAAAYALEQWRRPSVGRGFALLVNGSPIGAERNGHE